MSESTPYLKLADNGTYYVHWTENRIGKRVSTRQKDLAAAQRFLGQWLLMERTAEIDDKKGAQLTVADLWPVYLERKLRNGPSRRTVDSLSGNLLAHFGALTVLQLTQDAVDSYVGKRTSGRLGRKARPHSVGKELRYLIACLNFCAKKQRMFDTALFEPFEVPANGAIRDRWLRPDEVGKIFQAAELTRRGGRLSRVERFLWLALETAGREKAIVELTWDRVDFDAGVIHLHDPQRPATSKRRASVPMSKRLRPVLERGFAERENKYVCDHPGVIWESVQRVIMRAGLANGRIGSAETPKATGISPHTFRHTAATMMARGGVPLWVIARILGNTVGMVEKVYAKWQPEGMRQAVDMISSFEPAE